MKFLQELIVAILMPPKARKPVRFKLSAAQQHRVLRKCREINSLIEETHASLSDIRKAGTATNRITQQTHAQNVAGRKSLRQQQMECERINGELKQISQDMIAVRNSLVLTSKKTFSTMNNIRKLENNVQAMSGAIQAVEATSVTGETS